MITHALSPEGIYLLVTRLSDRGKLKLVVAMARSSVALISCEDYDRWAGMCTRGSRAAAIVLKHYLRHFDPKHLCLVRPEICGQRHNNLATETRVAREIQLCPPTEIPHHTT